jgi:hypothetical protein
VLATGLTSCVPETPFVPTHPFVPAQLVAFVEDHVMTEDAPETIDVGSAEIVTVGVGDGAGVEETETVAEEETFALPPTPVQVRV